MKKIILILFACTIALSSHAQIEGANDIYSAQIDTSRVFRNLKIIRRKIIPENAFLFTLTGGIPFVQNDLMENSFWKEGVGADFHFSASFRRQIQKMSYVDNHSIRVPTKVGFGMGIGFSNYNKSAKFNAHTETLKNIYDNDGKQFDALLSYKKIKETTSFSYFDIPLFFEIAEPSATNISGFFRIGLRPSLLIHKKISGSGTYTAKGYYEEWDVELFDVPELGFYTDKKSYDDIEYELSPFVLWGSISGGIGIPLSKLEKDRISRFILQIGAKADYSLTPISKASSESYFEGSKYRFGQSNILGGDGSRIFSIGLKVGLIYSLW